MKQLLFIIAGTALLVAFCNTANESSTNTPLPATTNTLRSKASEAREYIEGKNFNQQVVFLIDMKTSSSLPRFFVYDLNRDSVCNGGLVTHGRCNQGWLEGRKYGNTVGCGCSSIGRYRIGKGYKGMFGHAYKLHGLDSTNDKAFDRFVVLHSHECVPDAISNGEICHRVITDCDRSSQCIAPASVTTGDHHLHIVDSGI